jgi:hypothetical protein
MGHGHRTLIFAEAFAITGVTSRDLIYLGHRNLWLR